MMDDLELYDDEVGLVPFARLAKDVREAARLVGRQEARFLVDMYYTIQRDRIRTANQVRTMKAGGESTSTLEFFLAQSSVLEKQIKAVLDAWSLTTEPGRWLRDQVGIGPVIAAGLLAHLDIEKAPTVSHFWRFAGLDPTLPRAKKGEKRHYNADLKVICWKAGDSFRKNSGRDKCYYGHVYRARKQYELERDAAGGNAEAARLRLENENIKDAALRLALESGHLTAGQLDARATRYAVKLLLAHLHDVMYRDHYGTEPPAPYPIAHLGHAHYIAPPA